MEPNASGVSLDKYRDSPTENSEFAIFDIAYECFSLFEHIGHTEDETILTEPFRVVSDGRQPNPSKSAPTRDFLGLRNSFAQWVDYTGALSLKESSLDTRLRGLVDISSMVTELLDMVLRSLQRLATSTGQMRIHIISRHMAGTSVEDGTGENNVSLPGIPEAISPAVPASEHPEWEETLQAVDAALTRLHFLASAIRKASAKRLEYDVTAFLVDEDIQFRRDIAALVKVKFPAARKALCQQLGDSIAVRRRMLLRKNRHARKLAVRQPLEPSTQGTSQATAPKDAHQKKRQSAIRLPHNFNTPSTIATSASRPDPHARAFKNVFAASKPALSSIVSATSSSAPEDSFEYPSPPSAEGGETHVQCPYCLKPLEVAKLQPPEKEPKKDKQPNAYWTHHVDEDLRPYICLFPECSQALVLFNNRREWRSHMETRHSTNWPQKVHTITWYCDIDHDPPEQFHTNNTWREHMRNLASHPGRSHLKPPTELQLDALSSKMQRVVPRQKYVCPLCERVPDKIEPIVQRGNALELHQLLTDHIANHIKSLSLLSLPCLTIEPPGEDGGRESIKFDGSVGRRRLGSGSKPSPPSGVGDLASVLMTFDLSQEDDSCQSASDGYLDPDFAGYEPREYGLQIEIGHSAWLLNYQDWKDDQTVVLDNEPDPVIDEFREAYQKQEKLKAPPQVPPSKYKVGKTLGAGTRSVVKECVYIDTGRYYAAKVINKKLMAGTEAKVQNEIAILKKVSPGHRNIVTLVDYFETHNNLYLIMDLALGGELFDGICRKGSYYESDAADIVYQILCGVAYLHDHGIVHRNLTAENLLFRTPEENSDILLTGFGFAKILDEAQGQVLTTICGTAGYMAPEVFKKTGHAKPADMWSIGVITYFLLCGYTPFDRESNWEETQAILNADYAFQPADYWRGVSDIAKSFVQQCLVVDPQKRMTAHEALQHPFLASYSGTPEVPIALPHQARRSFNARRCLRAGILAVCFVWRISQSYDRHDSEEQNV